MKKYLLCLGLVIIFWIHGAGAGTPGGQAGSFLRLGLGARAIAMGNAFTGLARDGFAGYYNPGSLPFLNRPELAISFARLSLDRSLNFVGFSTSLNPGRHKNKPTFGPGAFRAGFSIGWISAGVDNIDARDSDGRHTGMLSNTEHAFFFSFALRPVRFMALGLSAKVVNNRFPTLKNDNSTLSASGFGMDFGIYARPLEKLSIGAVIKDFKTRYTWNTQDVWERGTTTVNRFPTLLRLGAAYQLPLNVLISADTEFNEEQGWRFFLGGEIPYKNLLVARAGFNSDRITVGFGLQFPVWKYRAEVSYAYDTVRTSPLTEQFFSWRVIL